jgi:LPS export ABC transporter protein LptC
MKKIRPYLIAAVVVIFVPVVYLMFQGIRGDTPTPKAPFKKTDAYQEIIGLTFTDFVAGKKRIQIKTERFTIKPKRVGFFKTPLVKEAHLVKPELSFFTDGIPTSRINANAGRMNMGTKALMLNGDVTLVTADGARLSSKELAVDPKKGLVSVQGRFTLEKNGRRTVGRKLQSDIALKDYTIGKKKEGTETISR